MRRREMFEELKREIDKVGIEDIKLGKEELERFEIYKKFLKEYNKKVNLTAITEDEEIERKHFLDSILIKKYVVLERESVLDVGSGAGFPGVVLKIVTPELRLTVMDSVRKKTKFLELLRDQLGLEYEVITSRAEDKGRERGYREEYDVVVARAVKGLKILSEYCVPLIRVGGRFIAMKGDREEEVKEAKDMIKILGGRIEKEIDYKLGLEEKRKIVLIKKISQTPSKYPRLTAQILRNNR